MIRIAAVTIASVALLASPAFSADIPPAPAYRAPVIIPAYNWSGFYLGGHVGWGSGDTSTSSFGFSRSSSIDGWFGGGQIGYNWQAAGSPWVFGIEADLTGGAIDGTQTAFGTAVSSSLDLFGTVRGRVGYAWDRVMLYGTGGWAWGKDKVTLTTPAIGFSVSDTASLSGWTVGGGLEWALIDNWTAKVEYLYLSYSSLDVLSNFVVGGFNADLDAHTVRVGLNYRFGGTAPVIARY
jgi:outer membrane immunogenic protein